MSSGLGTLIIYASFFNPSLGDNVSFILSGAYCEGVLSERIYDGNNDLTFIIDVTYCSNWSVLGSSEQVQIPLSQLSPVAAST